MKCFTRRTMPTLLALCLAATACGDDENDEATNNATTNDATTNDATTNNATNDRLPGAGEGLVEACPQTGVSDGPLSQDAVSCALAVSRESTACSDFGVIDSDITASQTLSGCYQTEGFDVAPGVTLTLAPGTEILFNDSNASMQVEGTIVAEGTELEPVRFFGGASPGAWGGIRFGDDATGVLEWLILESGGGIDWNTSSSAEANLNVLDDTVDLTLRNVTLRNSAGDGAYFDADPTLACDNVLIEDDPAVTGVFDTLAEACDEGSPDA